MDLHLKDKVALIAGASSGLGFVTAKELLLEGAKVVICSRSPERIAKALEQLTSAASSKDFVQGFVADLANENQVQSLVKKTLDCFGGLDILITNSGGPPAGPFESHDFNTWRKAIDQILLGPIQLIYNALPYLLQGSFPSILTITSLSGKQPLPDLIMSNSLRPALLGLSKSLSNELGPKGIRVNSILPGWTKTERSQELLAHMAAKNQRSLKTEYHEKELKIPLRRIAEPEEFAKVATFLVSPAASYITGAMIQVDGGAYSGLG